MSDAAAGRLISIEGIDGSGKSTMARLVADRLRTGGRDVTVLDRRTATAGRAGYIGDHLAGLRALIWDYPPTARTSELGFEHWAHLVAAWFHAVDHTLVRPVLHRGGWIVADSWIYKFMARFAVTSGLPAAEAYFASVTRPHSVIWLDAAPEVCAGRRADPRSTEDGEWQQQSGTSGFVTYQAGVREIYAALAAVQGWERVVPLDVERTAGEISARLTRPLHHQTD